MSSFSPARKAAPLWTARGMLRWLKVAILVADATDFSFSLSVGLLQLDLVSHHVGGT